MLLTTALVILCLSHVHALPVIDVRALGTGQEENTSSGNKAPVKVIVPVVIAAVFLVMLALAGWWKRRRRLRQGVTGTRNTSTANTTTTTTAGTRTDTTTATRRPITAPGAGPDDPPRPPRRRRRRRASQISTKSLPAYNEQAGDEEIVLVRRAERGSMSDDDDDDDDDDNPSDRRHSRRENSTSFDATPLLDDTSPERGRISLASSTRNRSPGDHDEQETQEHEHVTLPNHSNETTMSLPIVEEDTTVSAAPPTLTVEAASPATTPLDDTPSYAEAVRASQELFSTTSHITESEQTSGTGGDTAGPSSWRSREAAETDALGTLRPKRKSVFRQFFALNKPGPSSSVTPAPADSVEMTSTLPRDSLSAASATQSTTTRHRPSNSISTLASTATSGRGHTLSPSLSSLLLTRSRSPTRSSDSLAQRMNISAPIPSTLIRTELSYPRSGPTPEQIRFLSSRDSLGRFGMPYGEEALAAARSRENVSSLLSSPPLYDGLPAGNTTPEGRATTLASHSTNTIDTTLALARTSTSESAAGSLLTQAPPQSNLERPDIHNDISQPPADQPEALLNAAMPDNDRRDSVFSTSSFVTANEGDRETVAAGDESDDDDDAPDSSPPTPTAGTYRQSDLEDNTVHQTRPRGQTILIPSPQEENVHPQLTFIPATPTVDAPARVDHAA